MRTQDQAHEPPAARPRHPPRWPTSNIGFAHDLVATDRSALASRDSLLALQRAAGNRAVTGLVGTGLAVQRHSGIQPEVAEAHTLSAAEQADLPSMDEANDLRQERKDLADEKTKLQKTDKDRLREINERLKEIDRRLQLRTKGDALSDEEETLRLNGQTGGAAKWFEDVQTISFLGRPATVHKLLASRLETVEKALKDVAPPTDGWVKEGHSSLREPGQSLHSFGLAIDLNPHLNPFLLNPKDEKAVQYEPTKQSQAIDDVIERAFLLVLGKAPAQEAFFERPKLADKSARVEASYDKLAEASEALEHYLKLGNPDKIGELKIRRGVLALTGKDPENRSADDWAKVIASDRKTLKERGSIKKWFKPEEGFLHLDKRLVKAMTDPGGAGLTWLGDDTIASGRDIMHFDMRGVGPIKSIYRSGQGPIGLGPG